MTAAPPPARIEVADAVTGGVGLTPGMRAATRAVADTLFTTDAGPCPPERLDWLCDDLDHFLAHAGLRARFVYRLCLAAISLAAPLLVGRLAPFHRLPAGTRTRALTRMERGPLGLAVFAAKAMLCILYYEHPAAARAVGYDAACLVTPPGTSPVEHP